MYCYFNHGLSMRSVDADYETAEGEILSEFPLSAEEISDEFPSYGTLAEQEEIKQQIAALELSVTQRRMREAVLGLDNGWLADVNTQITALRQQLT